MGQEACFGPIGSPDCEGGVVFSIDEIVVDPPRGEFGERFGHTLLLSMRVETGADASSVDLAGAVLNPLAFKMIGENGVTKDADFGICTDTTEAPLTFGPNQNYAFELELEVHVAHGVLALQPGMIGEDGSGGWEWVL